MSRLVLCILGFWLVRAEAGFADWTIRCSQPLTPDPPAWARDHYAGVLYDLRRQYSSDPQGYFNALIRRYQFQGARVAWLSHKPPLFADSSRLAAHRAFLREIENELRQKMSGASEEQLLRFQNLLSEYSRN